MEYGSISRAGRCRSATHMMARRACKATEWSKVARTRHVSACSRVVGRRFRVCSVCINAIVHSWLVLSYWIIPREVNKKFPRWGSFNARPTEIEIHNILGRVRETSIK